MIHSSCFAIVLAVVIVTFVEVEAGVRKGKLGDDLTFTYQDGVLRIQGTGEMPNFVVVGESPLNDFRDSITTVVIDEGVTSIGDIAFSSCTTLTNVTIPHSLKSIGNSAFQYCAELESVTFLDRVESIGEECFRNCENLNYIELPKTLKTIGRRAFADCEKLTSIKVEEGCSFSFVDGVLFGSNGKTLIFYLRKNTNTAYTIPKGVTSIDSYAFSANEFLESVVLADTVTSIGQGAFSRCKNLKSVLIPDSVKTIENSAFSNCDSLDNVRIPDGIVTIDNNTFFQCNLSSIIIPDSVTTIGISSFSGNRLKSLTVPESVTFIGSEAFSDNNFLTSVFYQGSFVFLDDYCFRSCNNLKTVCVPPGYNASFFCGRHVTLDDDDCPSFRKMFNSCYKGAYVDGQVIQQKRRVAVEWESLTSGCATYVCCNDTGLLAWSECNSTATTNRMCVVDKCIENESSESNRVFVDIELDEGFDMNDMDTKWIVEVISDESGVDSNEISIGWETDENGRVIRFVVYVDDAGSASKIAESFSNCERS